jgi:predicted nucleic acid-binding protein
MIVADTDVLIDALRGEPVICDLIKNLLRERRLATTAITRLELGVGASSTQEKASVGAILAALPSDA